MCECVFEQVFIQTSADVFGHIRVRMNAFLISENLWQFMGSSYFVYELKLSLLHKISLFLCIKIPTIHLTPITCYYHVSVRMHIFPTMLTSEFNQLLCIGLWIRTNSRFAALKYFSKCVSKFLSRLSALLHTICKCWCFYASSKYFVFEQKCAASLKLPEVFLSLQKPCAAVTHRAIFELWTCQK